MKRNLILAFFILLKFVIQYSLISPEYELHRDEFLHLDQAGHLAWGYLSVPPVTSWISCLIRLLGNSEFWVKFFPALFGALTMLVVWKTIEALKGNLFALVFGAGCITFSVLFRLNTLYQPNSMDVLCWTTSGYLLIRYLESGGARWLCFLSVVLAFGFLNKYNIAFFLVGIIPAILLVSERKIFLDRNLYFALLPGLIPILPNLLWQYHNNFPVFGHMEELSRTQLVNVDRWGFLRSQFLFFGGTFVVILLGLYGLLRYLPFKKYRLFFWSFFITLGVFLFLRAKDYYAIGLYPVYLAFGSVYIASWLEGRWGRFVKPVLIVLPVVFFIPVYNVAFPNKGPEHFLRNAGLYRKLGMLTWEDGKEYPLPQDFADMLGWKELAGKVDSVYRELSATGNALVLCDNYGQAGAINYYSREGVQAVSFNADYINWFDLNVRYDHLIRVKNASERHSEMTKTAPLFQQSFKADSIENTYAREYGTTIFCFVDAKVDINERLKQEVEREQARR